MMVSYVHDSTILCTIWDPAFQVLRLLLNVILNKERNAHASCLDRDQIGIFELPYGMKYIEEIDSGDRLLHVQENDI